ncbi:unnamed protein product [Eretmochelys imbricata]
MKAHAQINWLVSKVPQVLLFFLQRQTNTAYSETCQRSREFKFAVRWSHHKVALYFRHGTDGWGEQVAFPEETDPCPHFSKCPQVPNKFLQTNTATTLKPATNKMRFP